MFRKHDDAVEDWSPETVSMCARRQAEILDCAVSMLRPGGRLVYSTCTFSPEENEDSVAGLLTRYSTLRVDTVLAPWFAPGCPEWSNGDPVLANCFRLWPHRLRGEGHFTAVLRKEGNEAGETLPAEPPAELPKPVAILLRDLDLTLPEGSFIRFGERVFLSPPNLPVLRGLKVLRPGLEIAELRGKIAFPAHALALWADHAASVQNLEADDTACAAYLRGETLPADAEGWTLVTVDGLSLGWGKAVRGVLKNHYPKGLRTPGRSNPGSLR